VQSLHDLSPPFALEDGGWLAPIGLWRLSLLVDRLGILVAVRRFIGMGATNFRSLRSDSYVRMHQSCRPSIYFCSLSKKGRGGLELCRKSSSVRLSNA
jgi:hypothetical protein